MRQTGEPPVSTIKSTDGKQPAVCHSLAELLDLYPTISSLCGLEVPSRLQGKDISPLFDDPSRRVRDVAFCVNGRGFLLREDKWAYILNPVSLWSPAKSDLPCHGPP